MAKHGRYFAGTVLTRSRRVLPWESGSLRRVRKEGCLVLFRGAEEAADKGFGDGPGALVVRENGWVEVALAGR